MSKIKYRIAAGATAFAATALFALYKTPTATSPKAPTGAAFGTPFAAHLLTCHDGDTCQMQNGADTYTIRLFGADAPELAQPYGTAARTQILSLVSPGTVQIAPSAVDKYGRTVAKITTADGRDVSEQMVSAGAAWWYEEYDHNDPILSSAQTAAQAAHRGLWALPNPIMPSVWRAQHK